MSTPPRALLALAASTAALAFGASSASALSITEANDAIGPYISYDAAGDATDVVNHVTVTFDAGGAGTADDIYDFYDSTATIDKVLGVNGCKILAGKHEATCPAKGVHLVQVGLGAGNDSLFATGVSVGVAAWGDEGSDTIFTGSGNDVIDDGDLPGSPTANDAYFTGPGSDRLDVSGCGIDTINGGDGTDTVNWDNGLLGEVVASLDGVANDGGSDKSNVAQVENMIGTVGNDTLTGGSGPNRLEGGPGNDALAGGKGADALFGGTGVDTADYSGSASSVTVTLDDTVGDGALLEGDNAHSDIENVLGSAFDDVINGNSAANKLDGGAGKDKLSGGFGTDNLLGGGDDDNLYPGPGGAADHNDVVDGGAGFDTADYSTRSDPLSLSNDGTANEGAPGEADTIMPATERLLGGSANDVLTGGAGNDTLEGGGGDDHLAGGGGDDAFDGGTGADDILGGNGIDGVTYASRFNNVVVSVGGVALDGDDADHDGVAEEGDVVRADIENVAGGSGDDNLRGGSKDNLLLGGPGADTLNGLGGVDVLSGQAGNDTLVGKGDALGDTLTCGADNDTASVEAALDTVAADCETVG